MNTAITAPSHKAGRHSIARGPNIAMLANITKLSSTT